MADAPSSDNRPGLVETRFALRGRTARQLMTPSPHMVFETDPLETAAEILARYSAVPVVSRLRRRSSTLRCRSGSGWGRPISAAR